MEKNKIRILAIDDNQDNLTSVMALVEEAFPDSIRLTASNGAAAIELAKKDDPDVILLDIVMPGMDGYEVCSKLKSNPRTSSTPVVFLTALKGDKESRIKALEVGGDAFLAKPIDELELTATIRAMVRIKSANEHERNEKEELAKLVKEQTRELEKTQLATLNLLEDLRNENEARKSSEERIRSLYENVAIGLYRAAPDGKILFANPALIKMVGFNTFDKKAQAFIRLVGHETEENLRTFLEKLANEGAIDGYESAWKIRDGSLIFVRESARPVLDPKGKIRYIDGTVENITDRKKAEQALVASETQFRSLYENIPIGMYRSDPKGEVLLANPALVKLLGYSTYDDDFRYHLQSAGFDTESERLEFCAQIQREGFISGRRVYLEETGWQCDNCPRKRARLL